MTIDESTLNMIVGLVSLVLSLLLGGFAIWQSRAFARDAADSVRALSATERDITVSVRVLETQTTSLGALLGTQIDRLTAHVTSTSVGPDKLLEVFQLITSGSMPSTRRAGKTMPGYPVDLIRSEVDVARFAGTLNIFLRNLWEEHIKIQSEVNIPVPPSGGEIWNPVLKDSAEVFYTYLERLAVWGEADLEKAGVTSQLEAFRQNYVPHIRTQRST